METAVYRDCTEALEVLKGLTNEEVKTTWDALLQLEYIDEKTEVPHLYNGVELEIWSLLVYDEMIKRFVTF